jgi:Zn-dependent peptidase ImmA (M78 family)
MRNRFLDVGTREEIDKLVDRVHKDIGATQGRVELAEVRDRLQLDLRYYTSDDPNLLQEVVHKVRIGAKQIIMRPAILLEAVRKFEIKALFVPDKKRILLDEKLPALKKRWSESHEILHSLIPWHQEYLLGDTKETLSPGCHEQLEGEANYGAGRLLYPHKPMSAMARASKPSMAHIKAIAGHFNNTITSALWRFVEGCDSPCLGVIGEHPHHMVEGATPIAYFIRSLRFEAEFGGVTEDMIFDLMRGYCSYKKSGPLGTGELELQDVNGSAHRFLAETFGNRYQVLTIVSHIGPVSESVAVPH